MRTTKFKKWVESHINLDEVGPLDWNDTSSVEQEFVSSIEQTGYLAVGDIYDMFVELDVDQEMPDGFNPNLLARIDEDDDKAHYKMYILTIQEHDMGRSLNTRFMWIALTSQAVKYLMGEFGIDWKRNLVEQKTNVYKVVTDFARKHKIKFGENPQGLISEISKNKWDIEPLYDLYVYV